MQGVSIAIILTLSLYDYNHHRPHDSLKKLPPVLFAQKHLLGASAQLKPIVIPLLIDSAKLGDYSKPHHTVKSEYLIGEYCQPSRAVCVDGCDCSRMPIVQP